MNKKQKKTLCRVIVAGVLCAILMIISHTQVIELPKYVELVLYMVPFLIIGYDILLKALEGIRNLQAFDENFLMAVATVGAIALGEYEEGVAVMLFYQIGELFQSIAVGKSRRNISALMDIRPDYANLVTDDGVERVDPDDVMVGSVIEILVGEKVPIDGVVISGDTYVNTSALTGESVPVRATVGSEVISGSINDGAVIRVQTTKEFGESTASKILELVESSGLRKSKSEKFISKFAKYYTPIVCIAALLLAVCVPLVNVATGRDACVAIWVYRAFTFLVISCPCALVISIPLTFFAGIGGASAKGILVKGANYIETLSKTNVAVFDKTGTLTKGVFEVDVIHPGELSAENLLEYTAYVESYSNHPIARSIIRAYGKDVDKARIVDVREVSGKGVIGMVDGRRVACGNERLMNDEGCLVGECVLGGESAGTIVHVSVDGRYAGHIHIQDIIKPTSKEALDKLKAKGVRTVMLTGDKESVAAVVAGKLGVDQYYSELLPGDKVSMVEKLLGENTGGKLIFAGDGINDAPVLTRADCGAAMGVLGQDAAIEAADVVLMDDDPLKLVTAIAIAKKSMRIVYENIIFAIGIKFLCLVLGALGLAGMWLAIFADVGVMVIAVLNAIRALRIKE